MDWRFPYPPGCYWCPKPVAGKKEELMEAFQLAGDWVSRIFLLQLAAEAAGFAELRLG